MKILIDFSKKFPNVSQLLSISPDSNFVSYSLTLSPTFAYSFQSFPQFPDIEFHVKKSTILYKIKILTQLLKLYIYSS